MTEPRRLGLYARVSTVEQGREDATSIAKQITAGEMECARLRQFGDAEVVKRYEDIGQSGSTSMADRTEGNRAMADARRGKIDALVCWSMDRFTRNAAKGLADFEALEASGVEVIFIKENIDTAQPSGKLFRTILAAFAEFEREQIRDRTMAASYARARKGIWPGGQPPYGYGINKDTGKIEAVHWEKSMVLKMYKLRAKGLSLRAIATECNTIGVRTRQNNEWNAKQVQRILEDDRYLGKIVRQYAPNGSGPAEEFTYHAPRIIPNDLMVMVIAMNWSKKKSEKLDENAQV